MGLLLLQDCSPILRNFPVWKFYKIKVLHNPLVRNNSQGLNWAQIGIANLIVDIYTWADETSRVIQRNHGSLRVGNETLNHRSWCFGETTFLLKMLKPDWMTLLQLQIANGTCALEREAGPTVSSGQCALDLSTSKRIHVKTLRVAICGTSHSQLSGNHG